MKRRTTWNGKMACKCLDDLSEAEERVKVDGMFTVNRYSAAVEHPAFKTIKDLRLLFVKIIREQPAIDTGRKQTATAILKLEVKPCHENRDGLGNETA